MAIEKIKAFLKEINVAYETQSSDDEDSPYDPEFVKMILERAESARQGNVIEIDPKNFWESLESSETDYLLSGNNRAVLLTSIREAKGGKKEYKNLLDQ